MLGAHQLNVKSQSQLDNGGRETCIIVLTQISVLSTRKYFVLNAKLFMNHEYIIYTHSLILRKDNCNALLSRLLSPYDSDYKLAL